MDWIFHKLISGTTAWKPFFIPRPHFLVCTSHHVLLLPPAVPPMTAYSKSLCPPLYRYNGWLCPPAFIHRHSSWCWSLVQGPSCLIGSTVSGMMHVNVSYSGQCLLAASPTPIWTRHTCLVRAFLMCSRGIRDDLHTSWWCEPHALAVFNPTPPRIMR
jgi:hypothetical protein